MKSNEITHELSKSKDWKFDEYEEWFYANYKCMQVDSKPLMLRVYDISVYYDESDDVFEVIGDGGKTILSFNGEDIKKGSFTKSTYIDNFDYTLYFN